MIYDSQKITVTLNGVKIQPLSELTQEERDQRKSPDITITVPYWSRYGIGIIKEEDDK